MNRTKIEWVKNPDGSQGFTWNPISGCLNGCEYCYARKLANGRLKARYLANDLYLASQGGMVTWQQLQDPFHPRFWPERLIDPDLESKSPKGIFPVDMGELFAPWIPESWTRQVIKVMEAHPQHRFYPLTKQPQELPKWSPFPDNCWVGVTVATREMAHVAHFYFPDLNAKVKYISFEPLLDDVMQYLYSWNLIKSANWVIIGTQTKPYKPPKIEWVEEIVEAAAKAGIPVFLKDNLEPLLEQAVMTYNHNLYWRDGYYTSPDHPNVDLHLRQEMPNVG